MSSPPDASSAVPLVMVELRQLVLSILDDPVVSRVFCDAGIWSTDVKLAILSTPARPATVSLPYSSATSPGPTWSRPPRRTSTTATAGSVVCSSQAGIPSLLAHPRGRRLKKTASRPPGHFDLESNKHEPSGAFVSPLTPPLNAFWALSKRKLQVYLTTWRRATDESGSVQAAVSFSYKSGPKRRSPEFEVGDCRSRTRGRGPSSLLERTPQRIMENGSHEIPENANEHCPGPESESAGKSDACAGCPNQQICSTAPKGPDPDLVAISERMATVKHKILVLSGKGGVGKSTFAAQLSYALAAKDYQVGLLDIDICGPSTPKMFGLEGQTIHQSNLGWSPVYVDENLGVMSIGFLLPHPDDAVVWKGPRKDGMIKQFLKDTNWGELDYLVVDAPPGTSDEHITIVKLLKSTGIDGSVIVTTPQEVSLIDVRKEISFCRKVGVDILGVVENMSGLREAITGMKFMEVKENGEESDVTNDLLNYLRENAPGFLSLVACSEVFDSSRGGAVKMCTDMGVPFLGKVPMDPQLCRAAEEGRSCFDDQKCGASAPALQKVVEKLLPKLENSL